MALGITFQEMPERATLKYAQTDTKCCQRYPREHKMKWQRGLFRLWNVLSAFWIVGVGAATWATLPVEPPRTTLPSYSNWGAKVKTSEELPAPPWYVPIEARRE
jgi:hypothetical protein